MAKTLRAWRAEQLLSTRRIATLSGTSNKTIVQIENGRQMPTFTTIEKISRVLQIEPREVTEFALALSERAREPIVGESSGCTTERSVAHVLCVSAVPSFITVTRRLLATDRYGVTTMIGLPVTAEQVAAIKPDAVILDVGVDSSLTIELMRSLRRHATTIELPIVVTGRDLSRLGGIVAALDDDARQQITLAPFDRDLRELVAAIVSVTSSDVAEPTV